MYNSIQEFNEKFPFQEYVASIYGVRYYSNKTLSIPCPFHAESTPSCVIYPGSFYCFGAGCGAHGTALNFITRTTGLSVEEILNDDGYIELQQEQQAHSKFHKTSGNPPIWQQVSVYNQALLSRQDKQCYLVKRHFDKDSIKKSKIGYVENSSFIFSNFSDNRYCIPVYDENEKLVSARYRIDPAVEKSSTEPKYLGHPGCDAYLYNSHIISNYKDIVIVGSELDAAFLYYRYNINAVAPPGEGTFKREWVRYFSRKQNVLIWLDYDYAGINSALKLYDVIKNACSARIYEWDSSFKNKQDTCDFVDRYGIFGIYEELNKYGIEAYH